MLTRALAVATLLLLWHGAAFAEATNDERPVASQQALSIDAVDDPVVLRVAGLPKLVGVPVISRGQLSVEIRGRTGNATG